MDCQRKVILLFSTLLSCQATPQWDDQFVLSFILPLTSMFQSQEINWFISERMQANESENLENFLNTIHTQTHITQTIMTNNTETRVTRSDNKRNYLGLVLTTGPDDHILTVHDKVLKGRHGYLNFIILVKRIQDFRIAENILYTLQRNNFEMTFLYVGHMNGSSD